MKKRSNEEQEQKKVEGRELWLDDHLLKEIAKEDSLRKEEEDRVNEENRTKEEDDE